MDQDPTKQSFSTAFVNALNSGGQAWVQLITGILIIYGFLISRKELIWRVLLVTGISAVCGQLIDAIYWSKKTQAPLENYSILQPINEVNWILLQSSTVVYAALKLAVCLNARARKVIWGILGVIFVAFVGLRINIGRIRYIRNSAWDDEIARAHAWAFLAWGAADLVILCMIAQSALKHFRQSSDATSSVIIILLKSSIPRFFVMSINTLIIVIVGQIYNKSETLENISKILWLINASYPGLLLFDMLTTRDLLSEAVGASKCADVSIDGSKGAFGASGRSWDSLPTRPASGRTWDSLPASPVYQSFATRV